MSSYIPPLYILVPVVSIIGFIILKMLDKAKQTKQQLNGEDI